MTQQRRLASGPDRLVLSLFTGAGGLDLGLEAAGFSVSICVEVDEDARRTLMANRSSWKLAKPEDIHRIEPDELLAQADLRRGDVALLTGGPPCQPFSKSANWSNGGIRGLRDPRASTLHAYLKVVEAALPRVLILENVKGLASNHKDEGGWQLFRDEIRTINRRQGTEYDPQVIHLDAADYGVPQIRERVFILASIDGRKFKVPPPTHGEGDSLEPCRTAWDAIGDLDKEDWPLELEVIGKWAGLLKSIPEGKNYLWHTPRGGGEPLFGWRTRYWSFLIVILIAGVTTNLVEQNRNRLETHLRAAAPEWAWLMLTNPRLRDQHQIEGLAQEWRSEYYDDHDRRTLFISVMKNHSHLRNLAALLSRVDLSDVPAIIFDDEADQASLNTRPNDSVASSTYRNIAALRQALPRHTYLQYTATPQAPLLITRIDSLSADFAELVSPGEAYTGGQEFFGTRSSHVEIIPQSEIYRDGQLPLEPPHSLLRAMMVFFIGVAAGRLEAMQTHRSMLIHPSKATATHCQYLDWANALMAHWHSVLLAAGEPDRQELLAEFREAHAGLAWTCDTLPPFEQIQTRLPVAINQTAVTLVNSVDGREVPWPNSPSHILVGGEKLGRGYTVKGLTVTYMPRSPGGWTADTVQQRACFFGYHNEYIGYCRVYLHADVRDAYVAYVRHEQDMRGRLEDHHGHPLRE